MQLIFKEEYHLVQLNDLVHQLFQTSRTMTNDLNHRMDSFQLTQAQLAVTEYLLKTDRSVSHVEIAKYLNVEKSSVTRAVKHLEKNDFVEHAPSNDSRERRIVLSKHATSIQKEIQQAKRTFEKNTFHDISEEDLEVTFRTLQKIMNNINGVD